MLFSLLSTLAYQFINSAKIKEFYKGSFWHGYNEIL